MTQLLITAQNQDDIAVACTNEADIIDLVAPTGQLECLLSRCVNQIRARASLSVWLGMETQALFNWERIGDKVDIIRLPASAMMGQSGDILRRLAYQKQLIWMLDAPILPPFLLDLLPEILSKSVAPFPHAVMLETTQPLLRQYSLIELQDFINKAHESGVQVALSGLLEPPDIPRLLHLSPDILAFACDKNLPNRGGGTSQDRPLQMVRALIARHKTEQQAAQSSTILNGANFGTDRLIVRDFILPIEIGAYQHERGKMQRVRFNVFADVARLSPNPQDMRHIFSYDLIIDAIRQLVGRGHIDLVETLAERIAAAILHHPHVTSVVVRVEKLDLGPGAVGVEIKRDKP